jgi:hypothetical protein
VCSQAPGLPTHPCTWASSELGYAHVCRQALNAGTGVCHQALSLLGIPGLVGPVDGGSDRGLFLALSLGEAALAAERAADEGNEGTQRVAEESEGRAASLHDVLGEAHAAGGADGGDVAAAVLAGPDGVVPPPPKGAGRAGEGEGGAPGPRARGVRLRLAVSTSAVERGAEGAVALAGSPILVLPHSPDASCTPHTPTSLRTPRNPRSEQRN